MTPDDFPFFVHGCCLIALLNVHPANFPDPLTLLQPKKCPTREKNQIAKNERSSIQSSNKKYIEHNWGKNSGGFQSMRITPIVTIHVIFDIFPIKCPMK